MFVYGDCLAELIKEEALFAVGTPPQGLLILVPDPYTPETIAINPGLERLQPSPQRGEEKIKRTGGDESRIRMSVILCAAGASFIRVNVFSGVAFTDQGVIEGCAREVLALRKALAAKVAVLADIHVKHAFHLGNLSDAARDAARNGAELWKSPWTLRGFAF